MPTVGSIDQAVLVLGLLAPGFIILFFRAQLLAGRIPPVRDAAFPYVLLSAVYYALVFPLTGGVVLPQAEHASSIALWFALIFMGPMIFGLVLGLLTRFDVLRKLIARFGVNPVHAVPTAWDWKFSRGEPSWVMVTCKNGTVFSGLFGARSFASSDPDERDLYVEQLYDVSDKNIWSRGREGKGLFVAASEIRTIEFWPISDGEHQ